MFRLINSLLGAVYPYRFKYVPVGYVRFHWAGNARVAILLMTRSGKRDIHYNTSVRFEKASEYEDLWLWQQGGPFPENLERYPTLKDILIGLVDKEMTP